MIVIGGGDTGADCIGTSLRHGCKSLINFELLDQPPAKRAPDNPWPQWPKIHRTDYAHEETIARFGADPRNYAVVSKEFLGSGGQVTSVKINRVAVEDGQRLDEDDGRRRIDGDARGRSRAARDGLPGSRGVPRAGARRGARSALELSRRRTASSRPALPGVFAAGDCRRGQSLVVWAINEGRGAARAVDEFLMGESQLPAPKLTQGGATG